MKLISVNKKEKSVVELEIEVKGAAFKKAVEEAYNEMAPNISVRGFRKGHAPRHIVEKMYGKGAFYEKAVNKTYPDAYEAAVKEAGLDAVAHGEVEIKDINDEGYIFLAQVPVRPEVKLGEYKGLSAEKDEVKIDDHEVEHELEHIQKAHARTVEVSDRAAQMGDTVVLDFEGFVDGAPFEGGKGENYTLKLGSGSFIPGFEEQLAGKTIDEDATVSVTFPEDYHEKSLAGKPAEFKCKIHAIKYEELPELDDDFAKDVSEFDTLADYKADIKKHLTEYAEAHADRMAEQKVMDQIIEGVQAEIPDAMIEAQLDQMVNEYDQNMRQQGLDLQTYLKYTNSTVDQFRDGFRENAEKTVKARLALEEIAKLEKIAVGEDDIEAEYKRIADQYSVPVEQVKAFIPADQLSEDIAVDKALKFVMAQAKITVKKAAAKKPAAKKSAAKKTEE